jgi:uncharacterized protein (TIGR02271 family)
MNSTTSAPDQLFGYDVIDDSGNKIGTVDNIWVDDATGELEFVGVKTGWLFGKTHIIPAADAQISDNSISVPFPESQIKDAPSFSADDELSPTDENGVYDYYGMQRSMSESPSGLAEGGENINAGTTGYTATDAATGTADLSGTTGYAGTDTSTGVNNEGTMALSEEDLTVGKREVEAGRVRLRKVVRTEHEEVPVELQKEQVSIERVDASATDVPSNAFQEQEIEVPVMREEAVVSKESHVTGGVALNKNVQTETRTVGGDVRSEDVEVVADSTDGTTSRESNRSY